MPATQKSSTEDLRRTLQDAVVKCSERCLYRSAKWAAELAASLPLPSSSNASFETDPDSSMGDIEAPPTIPPTFSSNSDPEEARLEAREYSRYLLAKSYFDCREFDRCANVFLPQTAGREPLSQRSANATPRATPKSGKGKGKNFGSSPTSRISSSGSDLPLLSQKALFMSLYARLLSGEKRKDEESEMILGPSDVGTTVNKELVVLARTLETWFATRASKGQDGSNQGWLEYLYGVVLSKGKTENDAKRWLIRSVHICPFNWSAWLELGDLIGNVEELQKVLPELPQNLMSVIFNVYANQELYQSTDTIHHALSELENFFPGSQFLKTQRALMYYHSKGELLFLGILQEVILNLLGPDFAEAESTFSSILHQDPHRIDSLDHYSNILYVLGARSKLAFLAQVATATDKFRPETCCVVGNYYSLKSEHEKAVIYFRRALTLDRSFLSAWTLMGHEYIEMKNTHAAIESYRRAVDVNRKDYRAWYGLGQAYEILEMHSYALFYYQRAAALRAYDPKMWHAVGNCYDKINRPVQSIKAYKRALVAGSYFDNTNSNSSVSASFGSSQGPATRVGDGKPSQESGGATVLDPETLYAIALLYEKIDDMDEAAAYMEMTLAQEEGSVPADFVSKSTTTIIHQDDDDDDEDDDEDANEAETIKDEDDDEDDDVDIALRSDSGAEDLNSRPHPPLRDHRQRGSTTNNNNDNDPNDDNDNEDQDSDNQPQTIQGPGTGMTTTTSKARIWLARWSFSRGDLKRAMDLANELCQDGVEVEEAKALIRDLRARMDAG